MRKKSSLKDVLLLLAALTAGFLAVSGGGFADYAKKSFWQHFWAISAWVGFAVFVGGWLFLAARDRAATKSDYNQKR
jgi:lipopolysaccharide export LptBFGC system permease protein LptF